MSKEGADDNTGKKKKKRKKNEKDPGRFRIIDTSAPSTTQEKEKNNKRINEIDEEEDRYDLIEEKPQVAAVVDERPALMTGKWKKVEEGNNMIESTKGVRKSRKSKCLGQNSSSEEGNSPPRRFNKRHDSSSEGGHSPQRITRHDSSSDNSPLRSKIRHDSSTDNDSPVNSKKGIAIANKDTDQNDSDNSPPRQKVKRSPNRQSDINSNSNLQDDSDNSPPRTKNVRATDSDNSPPRAKNNSSVTKKTLDGKKAGLQTATSLKSEMDLLRGKEKKRLEDLSSDISGKGAQTVIRGRLKEKQEDEQKRKAQAEISEQVKEQYGRWSKGLKQMDNDRMKNQKDRHEMGKSFARAADDEDMNDQLKGVERSEDPMLAYMQSKRKKVTTSSGIKQYPEYKGPPPPPNRFGIKPGYRWDGVDRSTGFEKRLFEHGNKKKAVAEEAYKWSTEDM